LKWQIAAASVLGTSHIESGIVCQDVCLADLVKTANGETVLIAVASDGAGSASLSHIGASTVCSFAHILLKDYLADLTGSIDFTLLDPKQFVREIRAKVAEQAEQSGVVLRELACTLLLAAIAEKSSLYLQIGDGAIVTGSEDTYSVIFWPESGEYANMTYFVTDETAEEHLQHAVNSEAPHQLAMFTDGLQRLALRYADKLPHDAFFVPLFRTLREWHGKAEALREALIEWLQSQSVNDRTDDDKTLILAAQIDFG
jgi:hypothetical protein